MAYVDQTRIITALLGELERQMPGVCVSQAGMNALIQAANIVVAAQAGYTVPKESSDES